MNQQRSRRFRASKEIAEKVMTIATVRESLMARGAYVPSEKSKGEHFDSNCITPVMSILIAHLITSTYSFTSVFTGHAVYAQTVSLLALLCA